MKSKAVSGTMLTLLLISVLSLAFNIQPIRASGTIYIRPDGSVEGTDKIHRDEDVYSFTDNIYDEIVVEIDNVVVDGAGYTLEGTGSGRGIDLPGRTNVTIKNTEIKSFNYGIYLNESSNINISGNNITNNSANGIVYLFSNYNSISGNHITNNGGDGIWFFDVHGSSISGNNITNNRSGIRLDKSLYNSISGNNVTANIVGISICESRNTNICGNNIVNNEYGVWVVVSPTTIYHNNFINNTNQVFTWWMTPSIWDDGYPSGGNYWSDHIKVDHYSGVNQDDLGSDGIVDEPYVIDANNRDNYPLVKPYGVAHDIGITGITPSETLVEPGSMLDINITVMNYGLYTETFNLIAYVNTTVISQTEVTLSSRNSATITFEWDTTGVTVGNYIISAYATPVPNEIDRSDNYFEDCMVTIATPEYLTQKLIETIKTWNLPQGTENSLTSKLQEAILLLNNGNENGAIHKLMDLINEVEALRDKGKMEDWQTDYLITETQTIIDLING